MLVSFKTTFVLYRATSNDLHGRQRTSDARYAVTNTVVLRKNQQQRPLSA